MGYYITLAFVAISGWFAGALVNYLTDVLPYKRKLVKPFCTRCGAEQPLLNYLFGPRRCTACTQRRSWRSILIEIAYIVIALGLWRMGNERLGGGAGIAIWIYLGVVTVIDIEHRVILHPVSMAGAVLGLALGSWLHGWQATLLGGLAGFGIMWLFYLIGIGFLHIRSRMKGGIEKNNEDALGFGDVNLSGVLGLFLGWPGILAGLLITILIAGIASLLYLVTMLISRKYHPNLALPFGPFLVAGTLWLLYFKDFFILIISR